MGDQPVDRNAELPSIGNLNPELESLRNSYSELQARTMPAVENLASLRSGSLDLFQAKEEEAKSKERSELVSQIEVLGSKDSELLEERSEREKAFSALLISIRSAKKCFKRIGERIDGEESEGIGQEENNLEGDFEILMSEAKSICRLGMAVESKFLEYEEMRRNEKTELESSLVNLTEENSDICKLLSVSLAEKAAVERSLCRLKSSEEQKRSTILQIAERGLQKVGFGFVVGLMGRDSNVDLASSSSSSMVSDGNEYEEEAVSTAATAVNIMKNLRLEVINLRRALEDSRSDNANLQTLIDKQAQKIMVNELRIKDLEERENVLSDNVEELKIEITDAKEDVARWRKACELEVEAGKATMEECEEEIALLKEEMEMTKTALDAANNKLKMKEKLAATAMAAQAAAEASLRLADSRHVGFRQHIEELTRQLEEESERRRQRDGSRRVRYVCWPWQVLRVRSTAVHAASLVRDRSRRTLPEAQALLHFNINGF